MKPKNRKPVLGVGINDADYVTRKYETTEVDGVRKRKLVWFCPYYRAWASMLDRCYSTKRQERNQTYKGCSVTDNWLTFTNFKSWMIDQDWEGKQLDKDLLIEGNKLYSPETCVFVTPMVNTFAVDCGASRGKWPVGVARYKPTGKFRALCSNPFTRKNEYLGLFDCEQEAHNAWAKRKRELAHDLAAIQTDARVAKALIDRYSNHN